MRIMNKVIAKRLEKFSVKYFIDYLNEGYSEIYNLK